MAQTLSIDASALAEAGFNSLTYFTEFFDGLVSGDGYFYGGEPDSAFGGEYFMNGSQHLRAYTDGTDPVDRGVLIDGADLAYDFIHYGPDMGHGISGSVDSVIFGDWVDGVTTGTQGNGEAGRVADFAAEVVIDGFGLSAEAGAGNDPEVNEVYAIYKMIQDLDPAGLGEVFEGYALEITGTIGADVLQGTGNEDVLIGMGGDDVLRGKANHDVLIGGAGGDTLIGNRGRDVLIGGQGDDVLEGRIGRDTLKGGSGNDTLIGGMGTDRLTGGAGADTFVILTESMRDIIRDFDGSEDLIDVSDLSLTSLSDFTITEDDKGTVLAIDTVEIVLRGVTEADLSDSMFVF